MSWEPLRDQKLEIIITIGSLRPGDMLFTFGQEEFLDDGMTRTLHFHFEEKIDWQTLGAFLKWFPSKSQAMKNGWKGDLPWGFSEHNKKLVKFFILNLDPTDKRTLDMNLAYKPSLGLRLRALRSALSVRWKFWRNPNYNKNFKKPKVDVI